MSRFFLTILFLSIVFSASAQRDSLFIKTKNDEWYISHKVKLGETLFILARKYHVPPAILADANGMNYTDGLEDGKKVIIPLGAYNKVQKAENNSEARPVYYRVKERDNLFSISHQADVKQKTLQQWNGLPDNEIEPGQTLLVGYILYDATQTAFAKNEQEKRTTTVAADNTKPKANGGIVVQEHDPYKAKKGEHVTIIKVPPVDTAKPVSEEEQLYLRQTNNGANVIEEKGPAVFYDNAGKIGSTHTFFAFHNTAKRGTIIKVYNPGTDQTVYVKVLGPMPGTKQYHNSVIGISGGAKAALGINENKSWCELSYAGF